MAVETSYLMLRTDETYSYIATITEYNLVETNPTIAQVLATNECISNNIIGISTTLGGTPLSGDVLVKNAGFDGGGENLIGFAIIRSEPEPETITGFYLNGTEYKFGGGGAEIVYTTQAEYDALPSSKTSDGKHYFIYEGGGSNS